MHKNKNTSNLDFMNELLNYSPWRISGDSDWSGVPNYFCRSTFGKLLNSSRKCLNSTESNDLPDRIRLVFEHLKLCITIRYYKYTYINVSQSGNTINKRCYCSIVQWHGSIVSCRMISHFADLYRTFQHNLVS